MTQWTAKDIFFLTVKAMGIYFIVSGLGTGVVSVFSIFAVDMSASYTASLALISIAYPLLMVLMGFYLLVGMPGLAAHLYHEAPTEMPLTSAEKVFSLVLRIMGVAAILLALPKTAQLIMNLLFIGHFKPMAIYTGAQERLVVSQVVSNLLYLVMGTYLLVGGKFFCRLAFPLSGDGKKTES